MKQILLISIYIFISCYNLHSQNVVIDGIPRDTSFTLHSAYLKEIKKRPYIKKVTPEYPENISSFKNITYSKPYPNRELKLNIYRPNDTIQYPALIMVFGGGWSSGSLEMEIPMAQQIAKQGYVTIPIEYRLSPEAQYPAGVYDVKTAIRWVRSNADRYGIDTSRIAISGESAGGQLASLVGITNGQNKYEDRKEYPQYSSTIQAIINIDGVTNFFGEELRSNQEAIVQNKKSPSAIRWLGSIEEHKNNWIDASSVNHVTAKSAPICFINSAIPRFHDGRDETISKLNNFGIYSEVHTIPDTPHTFWLFEPWFDTTINYMITFLDKILKSE